jgi:hypothetical protein
VKGHGFNDCKRQHLPGWNKDPSKPWRETDVGKAYGKYGYKFLPAFSLEEAAKKPLKAADKQSKGTLQCQPNCFCAFTAPTSNAICVPITVPCNPLQGRAKERNELEIEAFID